jgi:hypothetical protein
MEPRAQLRFAGAARDVGEASRTRLEREAVPMSGVPIHGEETEQLAIT